jgi:HAD superfamily hydrolase (TIGR01509 family)
MNASPDTMKNTRQRRIRERATFGILPYEANYDEQQPVNASLARNVVFDFGGVLVRWQPEAAIAGFYADEPSRALVRDAVIRHPDWIDMDRGTLSESAAIERFATRMGRPAAEMRALMQHIKDSLTPLPDSIALLDELAQRGVPLYGLSNMSAPIFALLKSRHGHWDRFRGIVVSGEVGLVKPEPEIFHHLAQRYDLIPAETVFIDDHLPNIESARRLGFHTIHFADAEQCRRELETHLPP